MFCATNRLMWTPRGSLAGTGSCLRRVGDPGDTKGSGVMITVRQGQTVGWDQRALGAGFREELGEPQGNGLPTEWLAIGTHEVVSSPSLAMYKLKPQNHLAGSLESPGDNKVYNFPPSSEFL